MTRTPVTSTAIASIGHDPTTHTLEVEFTSGKVYTVPNVSPDEHTAFLAAESLGRHFNQQFRGRAKTAPGA